MLLTEVEAPESEYRGPEWASYFGFIEKDVFAWTYVVGDGYVHIGTAAFSKGTARKQDMRFDEFLEHLRSEDHIARDFAPRDYHTSGGSIRMFADHPMTSADGTCHVIGDAAGLMQRDAYNGITNAILSGRLCANAIAQRERTPRLRQQLNPYLYQDVLRDMLSRPLPFLRRV
jgi:flavin-dependent dehydrogenase